MWLWSKSSDRRRETVWHTAIVAVLGSIGLATSHAATYVVTNAGHSAMERENALALTAIMDGLPPIA